MWDKIIGLAAPLACIRCGVEGLAVCKNCQTKIISLKRSSCYLCNRITRDWRSCSTCRHKTRVRGAIIASHYEGFIKQLILNLKYQRTRAAADCLAGILDGHISRFLKFDLVTSVPITTNRARQRGYNQAELIAKPLAKRLGTPYLQTLSRLGQTRQVGTERKARLQQMAHTMYVYKPQKVKGMGILLIDDVITTGATITEAARALKAAGAKYIWAAAVAKH